MNEQLNTIGDMVDQIIDLVLDMNLPPHVTRSVCSHLYALCSDLLEGAAIEEETDNEKK